MKKLILIVLLLPIFAGAQNNVFTVPGKLKIKIVPNNLTGTDSIVYISTSGDVKKGVAVLSVAGTANRITSTGGINPVIDIAANYAGQSSITTLGTIATGTWHGTPIGDTYISSASTWNAKQDALNFINGLTSVSNVVSLGGTLSGSVAINNNGFNFLINQNNSGVNIAKFQFNGSDRFQFDAAGNLHANGVKLLADANGGVIDLSGSSLDIYRNKSDNGTALKVTQLNYASTGNIIEFQNSEYSSFIYGIDGSIKHYPIAKSQSGTARAYLMLGGLQPTANNDVEVGLDILPQFGTSIIATLNSGTLVGGSGYPDGTKLSNVTGGTGQQAVLQVVISGGVVQSAVLINGGINYTAGDTLNIVITDSNGTPIGSGATIQVGSITSYTGIVKYALRTGGRDVYNSDMSAFYGARDKVDKGYADTHISGVSLTSTTSGLQLAPKMTTTQKNAIVSPNEGDVVYDTTLHEYDFYNGSSWIAL